MCKDFITIEMVYEKIKELKKTTPIDLAREFECSPSNLTKKIEKLVKRNKIIQQRHPTDGRRIILTINEG